MTGGSGVGPRTPFGSTMRAENARFYGMFGRVAVAGGVLTYVFLLEYVYRDFVSPLYAYRGMTYHPIGPTIATFSTFLAVLPAFWLPVRGATVTDYFVWVIYLVLYVPLMFIPLHVMPARINEFSAMNVLYAVLLFAIYQMSLIRLPRLRRLSISAPVFWSGIGVFSLVSYMFLYRQFSGSIAWVGINEVYELRSIFEEVAPGRATGYFFLLQAFSVNPLLMAYGLVRRRPAVFMVGSLGQLLLYGVGGHKAVIASVPLILGLWLVTLARIEVPRFLVSCVVAISCVVALIGPALDGTARLLVGLTYSRTLVTPAHLTGLYYDFFQDHPVTNFAHVKGFNVVSPDNPYQDPVARVIGRTYLPGDPFANANFWADGMAGLGVEGVIFVTLVAGAVFAAINSLTRHVERSLALLALSYHAVNLASVPLFTTLLGNGLAFSLLLLFVAPRSVESNIEGSAPLDEVQPPPHWQPQPLSTN